MNAARGCGDARLRVSNNYALHAIHLYNTETGNRPSLPNAVTDDTSLLIAHHNRANSIRPYNRSALLG
jgi:hypothetical protein